MSVDDHGPNEQQGYTVDGITEDYGVADWWMEGESVWLRDCEGDEWRIAPDGVPTCLGGGFVADGPEPEEEEA